MQENLYKEISIDDIRVNPYQPRTAFDTEKIEEIAASIRELGIIQPIVVREHNGGYEIIAGERRFRGAKLAGMTRVPVFVKNVSDENMLQMALIENLHRDNLSPLDKALGFKDLIEKFGITQKRISEIYNMSRPAVANTLRLLDLDDEIKEALHAKRITEGHARALLGIRNEELRTRALKRIVNSGLSVRESEELSRRLNKSHQMRLDIKSKTPISIHEHSIIQKIQMDLGTRVSIQRKNGCGKIEIEFYSNEDLQRIIDYLRGLKN
jgi:ParB family chromosome partitioning protein